MTYDNVDNQSSEALSPNDSRSLATDASQRAVMLGGQPGSPIDVSQLPAEQQQELLREYAQGRMGLEKRAAELHMDVGALGQQLDRLTSAAAQAHESGIDVTVTHTTESTAGRTEVIIGNTEEAARGKLPKSQTDDFNWTPLVILTGIIGVVAAVAAVAIVAFMTVGAGG